MSYSKYNNSYKGKNDSKKYTYDKKKEAKIDYNIKLAQVLGITVVAGFLIGEKQFDISDKQPSYYVQEAKETAKIEMQTLKEAQSQVLKDDAKHYLASEIMNDYNSNDTFKERRALEEKYLGKYLEIKGEVNSVSIGIVDDYHFSMANDNPVDFVTSWGKIYCYVKDDEDVKILETLEKDDQVTVVGYCKNDKTFFDVIDCDIIKVNGKSITR